jgi:Domain of unknown function (DUF4129)
MQRSSTRVRAAAATVGLATAVVLVAMAARAPLSGGTPVNSRSAQPPTTALFMLLAGAGIIMLGALVWLLWPDRPRKDDPLDHESSRIVVPWVWKLVAIALPVALGTVVIAAALTGTRSERAARGFGVLPLGGVPSGGALSGATRSTGTKSAFTVPAWLPWTLFGIVVVGILAGLVVLWIARKRSVVESPSEAGAANAAVEAAIDALDAETDPRRAVIAAYRAMQRALGEHGIARAPAEAPREYLERALMATRASEREARTLTGLFEEARYSTHPIPERVRDVALSALRSLQRRLRTEGVQ